METDRQPEQDQNPYAPPVFNPPPVLQHAGGLPGGQVSRPVVVTVAAILWIVLGSLGIIGEIVAMRLGFKPSALMRLAVAVAFLMAGINTLRGTARGVVAASVGALIFGALALSVVLSLTTKVPVLMLTGLILAAIYIASGVLGLVGKAGYRAWKASGS